MVNLIGRWDVNQKQSNSFCCFRTMGNVTYTSYRVAWVSVRIVLVQVGDQTRSSFSCVCAGVRAH